ncbi:type VI secretion system tip protein VgrG [Photorhabdus noenieputensis]|uniref:type VI secretion system Vgr family protein n=1 Tax=Photorhabdus noenieputensis TaxID=1208607 RepID=UPI001BD3C5B3|nr:type VI secretion system tip protein VgrG [Photorhabdus noenieputensis]MBS9436104.1 type VI secretion system tip protein VgrG [Photorhabdus noenieputensis]MCK3669221.1 type VI secretion system tip protein VgrG [Photorhabdus noenieputensis]
MKTGLRFSCTIGNLPPMTFAVVNFTLDEALSSLFTLSLTLAANRSDIDTDTLLLQTGRFTVTRDDILQREVKGLVESAVVGTTNRHQTQYHLTVRPEMWLLTLDQDSRIYHQLSVPDILQSILKQKKLRANMHLNNPHSTREYVTMKRESSYDFFTRLAAEEGIFFWFADDGLYLSDSYLNMRAPDTLIYNPDVTSAVEENVIYKWSLGSYMRPESTDQKDRNYHNPNYALQHNATDFEAENGTPFHIFESYGRFQKDKEGMPFTQYRLEALRVDSKSGQADSNCIRLMPGRIFTLTNHPIDAMNDRWQVVSSQHTGHVPAVLGDNGTGTTLNSHTQFIPGRNDWRPPYRYKPLADGDEVATVVGPGTEEIYVNKDGAVRVHFHWNRYDAPDDQASCWVRVAQGWNGNGFGFLATPRVGQEVIISYLNGDIDRPIITGCTYNGLNRPPLNLPAEKTRTTFRTKTHKGNGFNELRFEDEKGREEIYIHAQRDQLIQINHDKTQKIEHDESHTVMNDRRHKIGNDEFIRIMNEQHIQVDKNQFETIEKDKITRINNSWKEEIYASHFQQIGENKQSDIKGNYQLNVIKGIHSHTKIHTLQASDTLILRGKAGSITLDAQGITLNGNIFLKGPVVVQGGSAGTVPTLTGAANEGQPIAQDCKGKADAQKETSE